MNLHSTSPGDAGFTLLEVIIAFVIAALALGALHQAALTGLHSVQAVGRYEQALSRARSRLVITTHGSPLQAGDWRGDDGGGFRWRVHVAPIRSTSVRPFDPAAFRPLPDFSVTLYAVNVWISWRDFGEDRFVRLDTEQLGQASR